MKSKKIVITFVIVVTIAAACAIGIGAEEIGLFKEAGQLYKQAMEDDGSQVAAEYNGKKLLMSRIEYERTLTDESDYEIAKRLIENTIIYEKAVEFGCAATQEEIDAAMQSQKDNYNQSDYVKQALDDYCEGLGITIEQYWVNLEEYISHPIARQKLRDELGRRWCEENGEEFTKVNPPQEMLDAIEKTCAEIIESRQDEVVYYVDMPR